MTSPKNTKTVAMATKAKRSDRVGRDSSKIPISTASRALDLVESPVDRPLAPSANPAKSRIPKRAGGPSSRKSATAPQPPAQEHVRQARPPEKRKQRDMKASSTAMLQDPPSEISDDSDEQPKKRPALLREPPPVLRQHLAKATPEGHYNSLFSDYTPKDIRHEITVIELVYQKVKDKLGFKGSNYVASLEATHEEMKRLLDPLASRSERLATPNQTGMGLVLQKSLRFFKATSTQLQQMKCGPQYRMVAAEMRQALDDYSAKFDELQAGEPDDPDDPAELAKITNKMATFTLMKSFAQAGLAAAEEGMKTKFEPGVNL